MAVPISCHEMGPLRSCSIRNCVRALPTTRGICLTPHGMDERQAAQHIANGYDELPYEAPDDPGLHSRAVLCFGGVFGWAGALGDVLDLGCGTGGQLESTACKTPAVWCASICRRKISGARALRPLWKLRRKKNAMSRCGYCAICG